jgi:hypothetical protein
VIQRTLERLPFEQGHYGSHTSLKTSELTPSHSGAGRWIPIRIDLHAIGATVPSFMRFLFYNDRSSQADPSNTRRTLHVV